MTAVTNRGGRRKPEPTHVNRAWFDGRHWLEEGRASKLLQPGWLVGGEGTFAGAERIDDAIKAWRDAVRAGWR